ncbi:MAG: DUF4091 domain-containing protein [Clostridia bacterium]|nr:DUF4091 domain-containing protein [Clostridia bacterium]
MEKNLYVTFNSMEKKVMPKAYYPNWPITSYTVGVAQNATDGCQFSVLSQEGERKNLKIEITGDLGCGVEVELLREDYVSCEGALYPDPVYADDGCFDLEEWKNVTYLITVSAALDTKPGNYDFKVNLYENGELYNSYNLWVRVWNFAINPKKYMDTTMGIDTRWLFLQHKTADREGVFKKYYDMLLNRYHICGRFLPYDILDPRADAYMSDPRVTTFHVPYHSNFQPEYSDDDEKVIEYYNKLKTNPEWLKKAMFYVVDEPQRMADYERIRVVCQKLEKVFPQYKLVVPYYMDPRDGDGVRAVDLMEKYNIVWCPKSSLFREAWLKDYMASKREKGERTWWYCCWEPSLPYANLFIDMEGFYHRALFWQQYLYGINGFLYWQATHWNNGSPWDVTSTVPELSYYCFGDGSMLYNGDRIGVDGPVGSLRLEIVRSAIEDYHMFEIAEEIFGRDYVEEQIKKISKNVREYCDDHRILAKLRWEIGNKISDYFNNKH